MQPSWTSFQSIFQLSVALNIGFTAVLTAFGTEADKTRADVSRSVKDARAFRDEARSKFENSNSADFKNELRESFRNARGIYISALDLEADFSKRYAEMWFMQNSIFKLACVGGGVLSYIMLLISSLNGEAKISFWLELIGIMASLPVLVYVVSTAYQSHRLKKDFEPTSRAITQKANQGVIDLEKEPSTQ